MFAILTREKAHQHSLVNVIEVFLNCKIQRLSSNRSNYTMAQYFLMSLLPQQQFTDGLKSWETGVAIHHFNLGRVA